MSKGAICHGLMPSNCLQKWDDSEFGTIFLEIGNRYVSDIPDDVAAISFPLQKVEAAGLFPIPTSHSVLLITFKKIKVKIL